MALYESFKHDSLVGLDVVLRIYVALAIFQSYGDLKEELQCNQSLKSWWKDRKSNPGPLAPQGKS